MSRKPNELIWAYAFIFLCKLYIYPVPYLVEIKLFRSKFDHLRSKLWPPCSNTQTDAQKHKSNYISC